MVQYSDYRAIEAIDTIRFRVEEACEEDELDILEDMINAALDRVEAAIVVKMMEDVLDTFEINTNSVEELAEMITEVFRGAGINKDAHSTKSDESKRNDDDSLEEEPQVDKAAEGSQEADTRKRVILYTPGQFPKKSLEDVGNGVFDQNAPGFREMRFAETDFLICFNEDDVCHLWGNSYLTGPSMIYAVDENEEVRSLTEQEMFKILSILIHKEEQFGRGRLPIFRLC